MNTISFILGAGFSVYAKISDRNKINEKLKNLKATDFIISTVSIAYFIPENYPNSNWLNISERNYIEFFIKRYSENNDDFDYEKFYDYCISLYTNHSNSSELQTIHEEYLKINPHYKLDKLNSVSILIRTIDQLIDNILYSDNNLFDSGIIDLYSNFLSIIEKLIEEGNQVNIFTLNHDILLENLLSTSINLKFDDGFRFFKTPYYIKQNNCQYRVKYYSGLYNESLKIFKIHGSIDNYLINYSEPYDFVKIPKKLNLLELYREKESDNKIVEEHLWTLYTPSFLSGDITKVSNYTSYPYYIDMFSHLSSKLINSSVLVTIGYGLMDEELNNKIFTSYPSNRKIIVIKPSKGNPSFYRNENVIHFGLGKELKDLTLNDITSKL